MEPSENMAEHPNDSGIDKFLNQLILLILCSVNCNCTFCLIGDDNLAIPTSDKPDDPGKDIDFHINRYG